MERSRILFGIFFALLLLSENTECTPVEEIKAYVGATVALPCPVDTSQCGELHSVKWYRDTSRIYVFSQVGSVARRAEGDASERMTVEYAPSSTEALLKISPVEILDEASYKCEITYLEVRENCPVGQIIKLVTLVRPESVRILGVDGVAKGNASMLGPLDEGTHVELICEAIHGRPTPQVKWFNGTKPLKALYSSHEDDGGLGTGTSKLSFTLSRGDLGAKFECRVDSDALDEPIVSWMTADVNVKPTKIELGGVQSHVVQGTNVLLICDVFGARPAAEVRWYNNSDPITEEKFIQTVPERMRDGTFTTKSSLFFQASRYENGNAFHCYAENSVLRNQKESSLHKVLLIEVYYPPVVHVEPSNFTTNESGNILLLCRYISNPSKLDSVIWAKNGKNLSLTADKYEGGTVENPPLVIKNVSRDDMGDYTCTCKNSVGAQESEESAFLNVQYPPSVQISIDPATPVKAKDQTNVTLVCLVTSGNPSALNKVRWYLGDELLKELPECNYTSYNEDGEVEGSGGQLCGIDPSIISLENVVEGMAGNYTCQGMNIAGWGPESEPAEVIVYYPPSAAKLRFTPSKVIKKASVTLDCSVEHPGRPENVSYLWYRGTYQIQDVTTSNWTISPVLLETKSNFTCIAFNEGGQSIPATVAIDVSAPPAFIQNLPPYQGVLMSSKNISLTCRVECSPICYITWYKDGLQLSGNDNPLYYVKTAVYPPDVRKNDFESIESTLYWNMTAWPDSMLDRAVPNSNYSCQSSPNGIGPGVNSTIWIAVDFPPENLTTSKKVVNVIENHKPEKVVCSGKGHPAPSFMWRRQDSSEALSKSNALVLGAVPRMASGKYICEATNRHGTGETSVYLNVLYIPDCTIETVDFEGGPALECTSHANPQEVTFTWKIKGDNDTVDNSYLIKKGIKGYLKLDSSVDSFRTYQCFVNNSVGISSPCERDVTGVAPWWRQFANENLLIIIAIIVCIIIFVIIICIIIIIVCRRKRANNKSPNPSSTADKGGSGVAPPGGGSADPLTDPDKGFYENLPFHGMQNPPNKTNGTPTTTSDTYIY